MPQGPQRPPPGHCVHRLAVAGHTTDRARTPEISFRSHVLSYIGPVWTCKNRRGGLGGGRGLMGPHQLKPPNHGFHVVCHNCARDDPRHHRPTGTHVQLSFSKHTILLGYYATGLAARALSFSAFESISCWSRPSSSKVKILRHGQEGGCGVEGAILEPGLRHEVHLLRGVPRKGVEEPARAPERYLGQRQPRSASIYVSSTVPRPQFRVSPRRS